MDHMKKSCLGNKGNSSAAMKIQLTLCLDMFKRNKRTIGRGKSSHDKENSKQGFSSSDIFARSSKC